MPRRIWCISLVAVMIIGLLVGFGMTQETTTIKVLGPWAGKEAEPYQKAFEAFTEKTGIEVNYITMRSDDQAPLWKTAFMAKQAPFDIGFMWAPWIRENREHITPVTDVINPEEFPEVAVEQSRKDGEIWFGLSTYKAKVGFWYSQTLFEEHGLTEPKTYDEFLALLEELKGIVPKAPIASGNGVGWPLSDVTEGFIIGLGGIDMFRGLKTGEVSWTDPEVVEVFDKLTYCIEQGYFGEPSEWTALIPALEAGEYGLYWMGSWILDQAEHPEDLGAFQFPGTEGYVAAGLGNVGFFVPKYTDKTEAAKKFVGFMASAEGQKILVEESALLSSNLEVPPKEYSALGKKIAEEVEGLTALIDLDDTVGGEWQRTFWDQLKLLWVNPGKQSQVLDILEKEFPK